MNDQLKKISLKELFDRCVTMPGYGDQQRQNQSDQIKCNADFDSICL